MRICFLLFCLCSITLQRAFAQQLSAGGSQPKYSDTIAVDSSKQRDIIDVFHYLFARHDTSSKRKAAHRIEFSLVPTVGYTLSTGFAVGASSVSTFFTQKDHSLNESVINAQAFYDSHNQQNLYIQNNIWFDNDNYKLVSDWRAVKYPDVTYGLGSVSKSNSADDITYNYIRFYQTLLRKVVPNVYVGVGYNMDYHWAITETDKPSKFKTAYELYGVTSSSRSTGINYDFLYDTRNNPENATSGTYFNFINRDNYKVMGSDEDWSTIVLDYRKYIKLTERGHNILAIWSYDWLTTTGRQPYLDLPAVGADMYNNTGRGYAIGRYRGKNMVYLETEYRFGITNNGLLGAVIFANAANYQRELNNDLKFIVPAGGGGIRIKMNKHADTNLCIDYGIGTDGSRGVFVNLGEVF